MKYLYDAFGVKRRFSDVLAVERLETLKQKHGSNPWPVIEACLTMWAERNPMQWESYLVYLDDIKKTRKDSKHGSSQDKKTGGILRYTLDIPQTVMYMIRCLYSPQELEMSKEFFHEFARRFPKLKVAEKI